MIRWIKLLALVVFSSGWVLPFYLGFTCVVNWCALEAAPVVYGYEGEVNSFPFLHEARFFGTVTAVWLAAVTLFWSTWTARRWLFTSPGPVAGASP
jgi:hypothetical protein